MLYGSVCSGIEAATVAWHPLGWEPQWFAEIDDCPSAVLRHHYPRIINLGDFTKIQAKPGSICLLVGGTPCQDFSVAGLRRGLDGERGNLSLEFLRLINRARPIWVVWENVPGVLSSISHKYPDPCPPRIDLDSEDGPKDGQEIVVSDEYQSNEVHAFSCFLAGLSELGYGWAYRVLDAQYFGVPQRRRRVFVVGYLGDWRRAAAVLFERHSLSGNPSPSQETEKEVAGSLGGGSGNRGWCDDLDRSGAFVPSLALTLTSHGQRLDLETENFISAVAFNPQAGGKQTTLGYNQKSSITGTLGVSQKQAILSQKRVRRLTPIEYERLQGFPDNYTLVPYGKGMMSDSARYRMIGNSMPVVVMNWIGKRINRVHSITSTRK